MKIHKETPKDLHTGQIVLCGAWGSNSFPKKRNKGESLTKDNRLVTCEECKKIMVELGDLRYV